MTSSQFSKDEILKLQSSCACLQARRKAHALTKEYDSILAPSGLKITQFSPLSVLLAGTATISELAQDVHIDRTTLTRILAPLQRSGYVTFKAGSDARTRAVSLTEKGVRATNRALGLWKEAQAQFTA